MSLEFNPTGDPERDAENFVMANLMQAADKDLNGLISTMVDKGFEDFAHLVSAQHAILSADIGGGKITLFRLKNDGTVDKSESDDCQLSVVHLTVWLCSNQDGEQDVGDIGLLCYLDMPSRDHEGEVIVSTDITCVRVKRPHQPKDIMEQMAQAGYSEYVIEDEFCREEDE